MNNIITSKNKPVKLCECGCGKPTSIATRNDYKRGYVKGFPLRLIHGHGGNHAISLKERFEDKIEIIPECGCWIWMGALDGNGYGQLKDKRKLKPAHRVSWQLTHGAIPKGMRILHRCDTPLCVNPHHLFLGTQQDNMDDMVSKHRQGAMGKNFKKIPDRDVVKIFLMKKTHSDIAIIFGISRRHVSAIKSRSIRKNITRGL